MAGTMRAIGLMSGTSLDGADAALVETDGHAIAHRGPALTLPYPAPLRAELRALLDRAPGLAPDDPLVVRLTDDLTRHHARAVEALGQPADIVGFHGQTILHRPDLHRPDRARTWQIGDADGLARRLGLPVAHDFRSADVAAGGQGAPLAPLIHLALAAGLPRPLAVLNVGGVANATWIGADDDMLACDTGPGNGPLDDWTMLHTGSAFDRDGALAQSGAVEAAILARLLDHPYFRKRPPKSLDRLDFTRHLVASGLDTLPPADGAATLADFVAGAVAATPWPSPPRVWLVTGGGRHNPAIMTALGARLGDVRPVESVGWDGDALEAQCFGMLAVRVLKGLPLSYPGTTGVPRPLPGGRISRPPAPSSGGP